MQRIYSSCASVKIKNSSKLINWNLKTDKVVKIYTYDWIQFGFFASICLLIRRERKSARPIRCKKKTAEYPTSVLVLQQEQHTCLENTKVHSFIQRSIHVCMHCMQYNCIPTCTIGTCRYMQYSTMPFCSFSLYSFHSK